VFAEAEQLAVSTLIQYVEKFFQVDETAYPALSTRLPSILEWKEGDFDWDLFIARTAPNSLQKLPAIIIQATSYSQEPVGLGDGYVQQIEIEGVKHRRQGYFLNVDFGVFVGTTSESDREVLCSFLTALFAQLIHEQFLGGESHKRTWALTLQDNFRKTSSRREPLKGVAGLEALYLADMAISGLFEGYEDVEVLTVEKVQYYSPEEYLLV